MDRDTPTGQYEMIYQATRNAILSALQTVFFGVVLVLIGIFGVGMIWIAATAFNNGTATQATFFAGLFGAATTVFAGYELYHL